MTRRRFRDLKAGDEFTDSFKCPTQTQRWIALEDAKFSHTSQVLNSWFYFWAIKARNKTTGEEKVLYGTEGIKVEIPK